MAWPLSERPYCLLHEIGKGGGGVVHVAEDRVRGGRVAIKTLAADAEAGARDRLAREHALLTTCTHPHLVRAHELIDAAALDCRPLGEGAAPSGPALVLEYLAGPSLAVAALSRAQALEAWVQVAHAVEALHAHGFVHRDLKPSNVLLRQAAGEGRVDAVLFDLGTTVTSDASCAPAGTLDYLAPETLGGAPPRAAADVHGLGGILFFLLTRRAPWSTRGLAESLDERRRAPPRLTEDAGLDAPLRRVLDALLAPDPAARPPGPLAAVRLLNRETGSSHADTLGRLAPRPGGAPWMGRADVLARVDVTLAAVAAPDSAPPTSLLRIWGAPGAGRTRLLDEIQVRARLLGIPTFREAPADPPARSVVLLDDAADPPMPAAGAWFVACADAPPRGDARPDGVVLGALSDRECLALASSLVGVPATPGGDGDVLRALSGGLPGPLEHVVRALVRAGGLRFEDGRLRVDAATLHEDADWRHLVSARIGGLSPRAATLLDLAAVLGRPTGGAELTEFAGLDVGGPEASQALVELVDAGLIRVARDAPDGIVYDVPHPVREVVLAALPPARTRMLHVAAAAHVRRTSPFTEGEQADHLDAAGAPDRAAPLHRIAGETLLSRGLALAARRHLERALAGSWEAGDRARLLVALARSQARSGDASATVRTIARALPDLTSDGDKATALALAAEAASHAGDPATAEGACRDARRLFRRIGSLAGRAECTNRLGQIASSRGDDRRARAAFRAALAVAVREDDRSLEARVLNNLGMLARRSGKLTEAALHHAAARDARRRMGDLHGAAKATNNLGVVHGMAGRLEEAAAAFGEAATAFRECGDGREEARCLNNRGMVLWQSDRLLEADDAFRAASAAFESLGHDEGWRGSERNRALLAIDRGRLGDARRGLERLLAEATPSPPTLGDELVELGDVQRLMGALKDAERTHARAAEILAQLGRTHEVELASLAARLDLALAGLPCASPTRPPDLGSWPLELALRWHVDAGRLAEAARDLAAASALGQALIEMAADGPHHRERFEGLLLAGGPIPDASVVARLQDTLTAKRAPDPDLSWRARLRLSRGLAAAGRPLAAAAQAELAREDLRQLTEGVDESQRAALLALPERRDGTKELEDMLAVTSKRQQAESAPVLLEFVRVLNLNLEVEKLLPRVVDFAIELTGADRGCLMLFDEGPELVRVARSREGEDLPRERFQHSRTIVDRVRGSGQPVVVDSFGPGELVPRSESIHALRLGSATCVPLPAPAGVVGGLLGALYVDSLSRQSGFGPAEVATLGAMAAHAATAIVNARLLARVRAESESLRDEVARLRTSGGDEAFGEALGRSAGMREVFALLERVAPSDASVLVEGESGTGKELVARALHARSRRAAGPFVAVDCGSLPESLIESELFGHRRGSFTGADRDRPGLFEQASGGTIFLDEIAGTTPALQAKLLRVLQEREVRRIGDNVSRSVDVRVVAASNRPLGEEVAAGTFRQDLYYRLNVVAVRLPPLRDRPEDIPLLARHFLARAAARDGVRLEGWQHAALRLLTQYGWPGNVRELANAVERAAVVANGPLVTVADLPQTVVGRGPTVGPTPMDVAALAHGSERESEASADLWGAVVERGGDFWKLVRDAYANHEIVREDVRALVSKGLLRTGGSYRELTRQLGLQPADYKRFMDFLRQNGCRLDFRPYRATRSR